MANPTSLTQADINYLQSKVDLGTAQSTAEYYLYLSGKGYDYGTLAYQFFTDTGVAGEVGRNYLEVCSVGEGGPAITDTLVDNMGIDLMTRDSKLGGQVRLIAGIVVILLDMSSE